MFLAKCKGQSTNTNDSVVFREANDPELDKAKHEALSNLEYFLNSFNQHSNDGQFEYSLKADFIENGKHEHMWIDLTKYSEGKFFGTLANDPQILKRIKYRDPVEINRDQIEDWLIYDVSTENYEGGFSIKVMQNRK